MTRCATSLLVLLREVNAVNPGRDKTSDGGVGDAAHQARPSSHNPDQYGVYRARDFDKDGLDAGALAEHIRRRGQAGDPRLRNGGYVIWNRRIAGPDHRGWQWRPYTGINAHLSHVHVSVTDDPGHYDDPRPWGWLPPALPIQRIGEDDMFIVRQTGKHWISNGQTKRLITSSNDEKVYLAAKVPVLPLSDKEIASIPTVKP